MMSEDQKRKISEANKKTYTEKGPYYQAFGNDNPSCRDDVKQRISNSVKILWENGHYETRINGMKGKTKFLHPTYNPINERKYGFRDFLRKFQPIICSICGKEKCKIDIHHIDEDHTNFLLTNLEPLCVKCHQYFHYDSFKQPYITITKIFDFESCHTLICYDGKCSRPHGHSYKLEVSIKKRINPKTGMVMDFSDLKKKVNDFVLNDIDHFDLNEKMPFQTTAENMSFWIWKRLEEEALIKGLFEIRLWETSRSFTILSQNDILEYEKGLCRRNC